MQGWVKFHRRISQWEWYTDGNTFRVFFHLILMANHKPKKWRGVDIKRGQLVTSYRKLALALDLSTQQIRTALDKLEPGEITRTATNKYTLINVENYDFYQDKEGESNKQSNRPATNEQQTNNNHSNKQITTNKNDKKLKNEKNDKNDKNINTTAASAEVIELDKEKIPYKKIVDTYNEMLGDLIPGVKLLSKKRKSKVKVRWNEELDSLEKWEQLFAAVEEQDFLLGNSSNGWTATFDWLIANSNNYVKVMERQYASGNGKQSKSQEKRRMDKLYGGFLNE